MYNREWFSRQLTYQSKHDHLTIKLISFFQGLKLTVSSTIARCIKSCLQKAGIDTLKFQTHSTRAAAAIKNSHV